MHNTRVTISELLTQLELDIDKNDPDITARWLAIINVPDGLLQWGRIVRGSQRLQARNALCQLAEQTEVWYDAGTSVRLLEAASYCCSLEPHQWLRASTLVAQCRERGLFANRVYEWTLQNGATLACSNLSYLADDFNAGKNT